MDTDSDNLSENRYHDPWVAEEPQGTGGNEPNGDAGGWPGVAPPAGWFLRPQADAEIPAADTAGPASDDAVGTIVDDWFAPTGLEPGESPITWHQDRDGEEPSAPAGREFGDSAVAALAPEQPPSPPPATPSPMAPQDNGTAGNGTAGNGTAGNGTAGNGTAGDGTPGNGHQPVPAGTSSAWRSVAPAELVVGATWALLGKAGGPGFQPRRPGPGRAKAADRSPWQTSQRLWSESEIQWEDRQAESAHQPLPPATAPSLLTAGAYPPAAGPYPPTPGPEQFVNGTRPERSPVLLSAPVFPESATVPGAAPQTGPQTPQETGPQTPQETGPQTPQETGPQTPQDTEPQTPQTGQDPLLDPDDPDQQWTSHYDLAPPLWGGTQARDTLLLEPELPDEWKPDAGRHLVRRRRAAIVLPVIVLVAVAVLALALLTGHGPKFGQLAANQQQNRPPNSGTTPHSALTIGLYPGQQQRGVFQTIDRVVASGNTVVATGSQSSDGVVRQQFVVSTNGGASWQLAPVHAPGGGQPPVGYAATRLAGGPGGWVAVGPQAIWTSPDGVSWTLAATHGITPQLPGDQMWVLSSTAQGYLAAGTASGGTQAVIWTSGNGLTWQRKTATQLGLAGPGETVQSISYATSRGADTVISGTVADGGTTYSGVWLSTDGGSAWTRVTVPVDHGAGTSIVGLGFDGSGLIAVRPGRSASGAGDGVAYFSPNGQAWQYSATINAPGGWSPRLVKGSGYGFVVTGDSAAGQILAYTSAGTGTVWQPTAPLGSAASETVAGATVGPASTIIAIGSTAGSTVSQQPVFLEANTSGSVRPVSLPGAANATTPELAVNGLAIDGGQQVAVGSADGYPAVWRKAGTRPGQIGGSSWVLVSSLSQVSADPALRALTGVTHGPAGWLAVGAPGPVVFTSADGTTWQPASGPGSITDDLAGASAVSAAAGPAGYVIVGKLVVGDACVADVWWSPNLTSWTRASDVNDASGSSQVLAVAADAHGFVSVGSHNGKPAVWTTTNGRSWTTIVLPVPAGASAAVLQQVAINEDHVAALGQETTAAGRVPFAELSVNGGASWSQVPFATAGPNTTFTALIADSHGFTAAGQFGEPGQLQIAVWTSANGTAWAQSQISGLTGVQEGGSYQITALATSGSTVTAIGSIATQQSEEVFTVALPAH
jgi:hypothetical protein